MNQELDSHKYEQITQLRSGSFGTYSIAKEKDNNKLFFAKISLSKIIFDSDNDGRKSVSSQEYTERLFNFTSEVEFQAQLFHPSIIRYIGFSKTDFNGDQYPIIFTEYPVGGTLNDVIYKKKPKHGGLSKTLRFICVYGIAAGMEYLHRKKITHFNLNPDNILMDELNFPKISEFSSAQQGVINREKVKFDSLLYTAPEIFDEGDIDEKVDVYSFGIILNEIYSKKKPYAGIKNPFLLQSKIANNFRPEIPSKNSGSFFKTLITKCWHKDPKERPSFSEILETLNSDTFLNNKKLEINKNDFLSYVEYINSATKTFETNPNEVVSIFSFIKDKSKSEIKQAETNVTNIEGKRKFLRRFTLHSSKSKTFIGIYNQPEMKRIPPSEDTSETSNIDEERSKKTDEDLTEENSEQSKSTDQTETENTDKPEKSDTSDKEEKPEVKPKSYFPSTIYMKLNSKCQSTVNKANKGDSSSIKTLINSLIEGNNGFPKNIELAISYLKERVRKGNTNAMLQLANIYYRGEILPQNYSRAASLYRQILSHKDSKNLLAAEAALYSIQLLNDEDTKNLFKEQVDYKKVKEISKQAADKGSTEAMALYGKLCLKENDQIKRDVDEAIKYLKLAVKNDSSEGMAIYGRIKEHYAIDEQSKEEAKKLYKKSHDKGNQEGNALLGFFKIESAEKDIEKEMKGLRLIIESKEGNNSTGINAFGMVIFNGLCDYIPDEERGVYYMKMAADAGNANAMYNYARCLETGRGIQKDIKEAINYYTKSLEEGCLLSSFYLSNLLTKNSEVEEGKKYLNISSQYKINVDNLNKLNLLV